MSGDGVTHFHLMAWAQARRYKAARWDSFSDDELKILRDGLQYIAVGSDTPAHDLDETIEAAQILRKYTGIEAEEGVSAPVPDDAARLARYIDLSDDELASIYHGILAINQDKLDEPFENWDTHGHDAGAIRTVVMSREGLFERIFPPTSRAQRRALAHRRSIR